jgi:sulfoxide reductase catalytic subunit YedY
VKSSEITPYSLYLSRRDFLKAAGIVSGSALLAACAPKGTATPGAEMPEFPAKKDELGDLANSFEDITNYNNFYEFTIDKQGVAGLAQQFKPEPWTVEVYGLVNKPKTYGIEDLLSKFTQEERIYRLRCVEAWSMVIPWTGFTLSSLLKEVEPTSDAKYVRFETVYRPGLYGQPMPNQNGAPIRLVVPWKYGFKSIKSIVKIELVDQQPKTLWSSVGPGEYGFYSNVNPERSHPRWSQASERRIGELNRRPTMMFNGYAEQVADLYKGMDLVENY